MLDVDVSRRFGDFELNVAFQSGPGVTALFGRSGAGKTSLINIIAGLVRPDRGKVVADGVTLVDTVRGIFVPKHRRRVGYVFQEGRLFPHLTVRQNLLFGRWFSPGGDRREPLETVTALLGLERLLARRPGALSGGEKQRVSIGRALLANPRLLLMDEPLASLDASRKDEILPYIERLRDETRIPIIYVSHSVAEVARLADAMVLLADGRVDAVGPVAEVMARLDLYPKTGRFEAGAIIEARVAGHDERFGLTLLGTPGGTISVPKVDLAPGTMARIRIRARDVIVAVEPPRGLSALNVLAGKVAEVGPGTGSARTIRIQIGESSLLARITERSLIELGLSPGRAVFAIVKSVAIDRRSLAAPSSTEEEEFDP
ncbi:MAG TPA: molybdenum ABC transporter ATP-binding protein [Candidatus Cybelea sp.]|nr:molybdenum ABC transporter ATP-binding protein [Candidatus Cybelea sp.]